MKFNKIIYHSLIIKVQDLYDDLDLVLMSHLKENFEGKCAFGSYIKKVLKIIERSPCIIKKDDLASDGCINFVFEAQVIELSKQEILSGCLVRRVKDDIISCESKYCAIMVKAGEYAKFIKEGNIISTKVAHVDYKISTKKINVTCSLFMPNRYTIISDDIPPQLLTYKINNLIEVLNTFNSPILDKIKSKESKLEKLDKKILNHFYDIFSKYKKLDSKQSNLTIFDIPKLKNTYISRTNIDKFTPYISIHDKEPDNYIVENEKIIYLIYLHDYYYNINHIIKLCKLYKNRSLSEDKNLWELYKQLK